MTPRQQRFIEEYSLSGNATQAAIAAGYCKHSAHVTGSRLLRNAKVWRVIEAKKRIAAERNEITRDYIVNELQTNHELARKDSNISGSNKALDQIADLLGFKVDKKHITHASDPIRELMEAIDGKTRGLPKRPRPNDLPG